ncbi:hypothetical protein ABZ667_33095 [Streptomyces lavendulae]|uniref:hypothetical protein n=1 Tax=Streptomyces lavendulae TaxID=1914 RepID=UPI00340F392B
MLLKVLAAVAALGVLLLGVLGSPDRSLGPSPEVIGEREMVRTSGPNNKTLDVLAVIDTGASASSSPAGQRLDGDQRRGGRRRDRGPPPPDQHRHRRTAGGREVTGGLFALSAATSC